jgi:hypothetical protein
LAVSVLVSVSAMSTPLSPIISELANLYISID